MNKVIYIVFLTFVLSSCHDLLNPEPVDRITDDLVLTDASSARVVVMGVYRGFAQLGMPKIVAGDMMADHLKANGTFTQYIEIGNHNLSASNGAAETLWAVIYSMAYRVNFLLEGVDGISELAGDQKDQLLAEARFLRAYAYFVGAYTFGGIPIIESTDIIENRNVSRSSFEEVIAYVEQELLFCLDKVPEDPINAGFVSNGAVKAALARFYLFQENWAEAERYANEVIQGIGTKNYTLEPNFENAVDDFSAESILEVVYSANDNPGTSTNFSPNNLFVERREIIPSSEIIFALQNRGGERMIMIRFDADNTGPNDNGWSVVRYGEFDNIQVFRLAEMYLIRAEARAQQGKVSGAGGGLADLNIIRERARLDPLELTSPSQLLLAIEQERQVELAFEGHRWYDLKRTGRANTVMRAVTSNWDDTDLLYPVPLREIQNNSGLSGEQNPGY